MNAEHRDPLTGAIDSLRRRFASDHTIDEDGSLRLRGTVDDADVAAVVQLVREYHGRSLTLQLDQVWFAGERPLRLLATLEGALWAHHRVTVLVPRATTAAGVLLGLHADRFAVSETAEVGFFGETEPLLAALRFCVAQRCDGLADRLNRWNTLPGAKLIRHGLAENLANIRNS